jgi:hypothetical protein
VVVVFAENVVKVSGSGDSMTFLEFIIHIRAWDVQRR